MKKATKSKAKSKQKPVKKSAPKNATKKKPAVKQKVKSKAVVKSKPKAKPAPKAKSKVKAKPVAKVKVAAVKKVLAKAKPAAKIPVAKPAAQKEAPIKKTIPQAAKPALTVIKGKMPYNKDEGRKIIKHHAPEDPNKTRYSDKELEEFRAIINKKLEDAKRELVTLQAQLNSANDHGTDDTANTFKMLEDGSDSLAKEEAGQLASRQRKFIDQLENALVRIENKTYGICRVTGKLIPKERLRAVPHTTQSIEAKLNQYRD
jgi:RNA polymerase-binding transcription factor DksA